MHAASAADRFLFLRPLSRESDLGDAHTHGNNHLETLEELCSKAASRVDRGETSYERPIRCRRCRIGVPRLLARPRVPV